MRPIPVRTAILVAKLETTLGTSIALAAANAGFRVMNPIITPNGSSVIIPAGTGNADIGAVTGQYSASMSFDLQMYGGAWNAIFLPSCGFDDSAVAGSYVFTDDTSKWKGITAGCYYSSFAKRGIAGAMGSFNLRMPAGQPGTASFRYKGIWLPNPGALPTGITWEDSLPPVFAAANALTVDGDATIACGTVEIVADDYSFLIPSPNVAGAYVNAWLKKPNFRIRIDPLATSAKDWIADWLTGEQIDISAVVDGGTGNTITVGATVQQVTAPSQQDQDEQMVTPLEFAVLNNSLSLTFA